MNEPVSPPPTTMTTTTTTYLIQDPRLNVLELTRESVPVPEALKPLIDDVSRLPIRPGDTLVFRMNSQISDRQMSAIRRAMRQALEPVGLKPLIFFLGPDDAVEMMPERQLLALYRILKVRFEPDVVPPPAEPPCGVAMPDADEIRALTQALENGRSTPIPKMELVTATIAAPAPPGDHIRCPDFSPAETRKRMIENERAICDVVYQRLSALTDTIVNVSILGAMIIVCITAKDRKAAAFSKAYAWAALRYLSSSGVLGRYGYQIEVKFETAGAKEACDEQQ